MKHLTAGVLGHVDHGKTALVKALTGTDTDRLKEEKERGISIVLGFAELALPSGRVAFVDVPGHERFVRTMVSGATGIGAVLLAVSACEGVKPQTIEHVEIAGLLGVRRGIVALTQCDRASSDERAETIAKLKSYLSKTVLAGAPIIETSALTGEGLDTLRAALDALVRETGEVEDEGHAYLPVDRVFTMPGAGLVVTGTLRRGGLAEGDQLEIYPRGARATVRQVQSHGERVGRGLPGRRTAVNLRNVDREGIARGDALAHPGTLRMARYLDVEMTLLASAGQPLRDRERLRVLFGTTEVLGRIHALDRSEIEPGETHFGRIHLEQPAAVLVRERFIVRSYSPMRTIGGGRLLGTHDRRPGRGGADALRILETLARGEIEGVLRLRCELAEPAPLDLQAFEIHERFAPERVRHTASQLGLVSVGGGVVRREAIDAAGRAAIDALDEVRRQDSIAAGLSLDEILGRSGGAAHPAVLACALEGLIASGVVARADAKFRLAGRGGQEAMSDRDQLLCNEIEAAFRAAALGPPSLPEVIRQDDHRFRIYKHLVSTGAIVALHAANKPRTFENTIAFHREAIEQARRDLANRFGEAGRFETADAKTLLGISRKYLIPLLEHLDAQGFTRRAAEARVLVKREV